MSDKKELRDEEIINEGAKKIKAWIRKPENLLVIFIVIGAFALRAYYLSMAAGQTLWWDEAEYMSTAKHWAFNVPYDLNPQRPPLFQLMAALFLMIGFNEYALKFLLVVIPSTILVYLTYVLGKELFNSKAGLFAAIASAGMWSYLFWGSRFQPDFLSMCFQLLSLIFFWKLFKEPSRKYAIFAGVFAALGFYFKISALLIPASVFLFAIFKDGFKFIKSKYYWTAFIAFIIAMVPFMLWQYAVFGNPVAFAQSYGIEGGTAERPLGWMALDFFYSFSDSPAGLGLFFILFIVGLAFIVGRLALSFDVIMKDEKKRTSPEIFSLIVLLVAAAFYIFYIQGFIEDRWMFVITPFIFSIAGYGTFNLMDKANIKSKEFRILIIIILFAVFFYYQLGHTNALIKSKLLSYQEVKESALWIKENSAKDDKVVSASYTQITAYSEREVYPFMPRSPNESAFEKFLKEEKPKYMMLSVFEGHPNYAFQREQNQQGFTNFLMPYLNSTLVINQQGQVILMDIKQSVEKEGMNFSYVYPREQLNGVFIYEISYQ